MAPCALTIAGSDSGGGAGIQADLKTFTAFRVFGMSALTAVTAQNTQEVRSVHELPVNIVEDQIRCVWEDLGTDAVKTGMLSSRKIVEKVAELVSDLELPHVVVDPVMMAASGSRLLAEDACLAMADLLVPCAEVVTPNVPEAEVLSGARIHDLETMKEAAKILRSRGPSWVVVKGGHLEVGDESVDVLYDGNTFELLRAKRVEGRTAHGTGCTFSAAIAASLARGREPLEAIRRAKEFVTEAIRTAPGLGKGQQPTNHLAGTESRW